MSGAGIQRNQISIKDISENAIIADDPTARLMYYFKSAMSTIEIDDATLRPYTNYQNYQSLSLYEKRYLLVLCLTFNPDVLMKAGLFHLVDNLPGANNRFFKISHAQTNVAAVGGIVIGGYRVRATDIMMFTKEWLNRNYLVPLVGLAEDIEEAQRRPARIQTTQACVIS